MDQQQSGNDVDVDVIIEQLLAVRGARPGRQVSCCCFVLTKIICFDAIYVR